MRKAALLIAAAALLLTLALVTARLAMQEVPPAPAARGAVPALTQAA
jgi:hypothetical protein